MEYVLRTQSLTKQYGKAKVVNEVSMHVKRGSIYGFIGENGAGKSTFMRMAAGLALPTSGSIELFGSNDLQRQRMRIGTLIESPGIYPGMSARENLETVRLSLGIPKKGRVLEMLDLAGLSDAGNKKVKNFSMGMKQRLGIAISLLRSPDFLILDEPINGLDPSGIQEVRTLLLKLNHERQITLLISSHILGELSKIATDYGIIRDGRLIQEFSADGLQARCQRCLKIITKDAQQVCRILEDALGIHSFDVPEPGIVRIFDGLGDTEAINRTLIQNGASLKESYLAGQDLEGYFMELTGSSAI